MLKIIHPLPKERKKQHLLCVVGREIKKYIDSCRADEYDMLIQLCDALATDYGFVIVEKRFVDVALRHGLSSFTVEKWKAFMGTKVHFDKLCGCIVYELLPNVLENSSVNLI